jgi:glycosyltransferase involved in cell wall biosynthesis
MPREKTWHNNESSCFNKECSTGGVTVSFYIFAYNQEKSVEAACYAALAQTYTPLELIFSDDCSSDKTFHLMDIIAKGYNGPHKIILNRNERNLGVIGHVNRAFEIAHGELLIAAAGDDVSVPERTRAIVEAYEASGRSALLIHSSVVMIDQKGEETGIWRPPIITENPTMLEVATSFQLYIGATGAWNRKIYEKFGPLNYEKTWEDLALGFRAFMEDKILYLDQPLVKYSCSGGISTDRRAEEREGHAIRRTRYSWIYATYRQRLDDLDRTDSRNGEVVRRTLEEKVDEFESRVLFYTNPIHLILLLCTNKYYHAARSIGSGLKLVVLNTFVLSFAKLSTVLRHCRPLQPMHPTPGRTDGNVPIDDL